MSPAKLGTAAALAAVSLAMPGVAQASFSATAAGTAAIASTTLRNGTGLAAACAQGAVKGIVLTWTASPDAFVTGYVVRRSINGATPVVLATVSALTYNDATAQTAAKGDTYSYTIAAVVQSWSTSPSAAVSRSWPAPQGKCV
ncbi:MAG: hypothetical protein JJD92_06175 [Frankiaceae bacterium]|nr:hypothetical protein [Frankiaceae bacterium]